MNRDDILLAIHGTSLDAIMAAWVLYRAARTNQIPVEFADRIDNEKPEYVTARHVFLIGAGLPRLTVNALAKKADDVVVFDAGPTAVSEMREAKPVPPFTDWTRSKGRDGYAFDRIVIGDRDKGQNVAALVSGERTTADLVFGFFFPGMPRPSLLDRIAQNRAMDIPALFGFVQCPELDFQTIDKLARLCEQTDRLPIMGRRQ